MIFYLLFIFFTFNICLLNFQLSWTPNLNENLKSFLIHMAGNSLEILQWALCKVCTPQLIPRDTRRPHYICPNCTHLIRLYNDFKALQACRSYWLSMWVICYICFCKFWSDSDCFCYNMQTGGNAFRYFAVQKMSLLHRLNEQNILCLALALPKWNLQKAVFRKTSLS